MAHFFISNLYGKYNALQFNLKVDNSFILTLEPKEMSAKCPWCGNTTTLVHSTHTRTITDFVFTRTIKVTFPTRKFRCKDCHKIFTEEIPFVWGKMHYSKRVVNLLQESYHYYKCQRIKQDNKYIYFKQFAPNLDIPVNEMDNILKKHPDDFDNYCYWRFDAYTLHDYLPADCECIDDYDWYDYNPNDFTKLTDLIKNGEVIEIPLSVNYLGSEENLIDI